MPDIVRKVYSDPSCATSINPNLRKFMTWTVYPSADIDSVVPVRVAYNVIRKRYEAIPSGGVAYTALNVASAIVHGFTGAKVKFGSGPNAQPVAIYMETEFGNYSTDVTTSVTLWYLSNLVAGSLNDTLPFAGAVPIALRFEYHSEQGEKVYVNAHGARFGQF